VSGQRKEPYPWQKRQAEEARKTAQKSAQKSAQQAAQQAEAKKAAAGL